jgi:hypothetical protein
MDYVERTKLAKEYRLNAKPGDLFYKKSGFRVEADTVKVERVTPTQIVLEGGLRIRKEDGALIGMPTWHSISIYPVLPHVTQSFEDQVREEEDREKIKKARQGLRNVADALASKFRTVEGVEAATKRLEAMLEE